MPPLSAEAYQKPTSQIANLQTIHLESISIHNRYTEGDDDIDDLTQVKSYSEQTPVFIYELTAINTPQRVFGQVRTGRDHPLLH